MRPAAALALILSLTPLAAGGQDFEYARGAVERGEILPLAEVLALLHRTHPGRVIEVDLDEDDGMMIYEVELVTEDGRLIEVELDAASGRILDLDEDDED
ncbi:PepSY domain-containing protein [Paracoccus thiocyanatus]|uniref:Peptidase n=1 Tax=Paracoccus thiocyanatus TaxID=34006 RepID=A0A3D8PCS0_9RHOB|nr:PepSY domain-containing protein [Paracoccus thiocyanatus]RDW13884.1 peptidase [Paracoccus thiocyanatus]